MKLLDLERRGACSHRDFRVSPAGAGVAPYRLARLLEWLYIQKATGRIRSAVAMAMYLT